MAVLDRTARSIFLWDLVKAFGLAIALDGARTLKDGYVTPGSRYRGDFRFTYAY